MESFTFLSYGFLKEERGGKYFFFPFFEGGKRRGVVWWSFRVEGVVVKYFADSSFLAKPLKKGNSRKVLYKIFQNARLDNVVSHVSHSYPSSSSLLLLPNKIIYQEEEEEEEGKLFPA